MPPPQRLMFGKSRLPTRLRLFVFAFVCRLFASAGHPGHCLQTPPVCKRLFASFVCEALRERALPTLPIYTYPHQMGWRGFCAEPGGEDDAETCAFAEGGVCAASGPTQRIW